MAATGPILVTGGCGFLGFHIVQALIKDPTHGPITVVSRNPTKNLLNGVTYIAGDVVNAESINHVMTTVQPEIIFHIASPPPTDAQVPENAYTETNVVGTRNLIEAAQLCEATKYFIFSSTVNAIQGHEHINVVENSKPYWNPTDKAIPYWRSKAEAEKIVLAANSSSLKTVSLRACMVVGLQEYALIPAQLDALQQGKTNIQLGDNKNLWDVVSADNCAEAYLLAMYALRDPSKANGKVDGEAFNITDDNPMPFWDVSRIIWRTAGDTTQLKDVKVIPAWLARSMASMSEFAYRFLFAGNKTPELNHMVVNACTSTFTYDISKAKKVLGYHPEKKTEKTLVEATEWEIQRRQRLKEEVTASD